MMTKANTVPDSNKGVSTPAGGRLLSEWLENPELLLLPQITIPYVAVEGRVTLLSGREKIGKSTFAGGVFSAASRGGDVLGVPIIRPICSLWYALDEHVSDTVRRFVKLGADDERIVINDRPRTADELLAALYADLDSYPETDAVLVDNLSRILAMSGVDPNSTREVEPVIARLVEFFHEENVSAVLLYHTGKGGREYRGSTSIGATVDEVLTLRKRGHAEEDDFDDDATDDGRRLLEQNGRTLRGRAHLTCVDGVYGLYDDASPPRGKILDVLRDHGTVTGRAELAKLAGVRKSVGLKQIGDLIAEGVIVEKGRSLKLSAASAREPESRTLPFPGSARFQRAGTTTEPIPEPELLPGSLVGSHSRRVGVAETGTDARHRRVIHRGGRDVIQFLRPTQHGDRWFDEDTSA
jgi:hypothetical protein